MVDVSQQCCVIKNGAHTMGKYINRSEARQRRKVAFLLYSPLLKLLLFLWTLLVFMFRVFRKCREAQRRPIHMPEEMDESVVLGPWDNVVKINSQKTVFELRPVGAMEVVNVNSNRKNEAFTEASLVPSHLYLSTLIKA